MVELAVTVDAGMPFVQATYNLSYLMVELTVTVDAGMPFVQAMYNLEGDGPLVLTCYETISTHNTAANQAYNPNLRVVTSEISSGNSLIESNLVQHAKSCVQPDLNYYFQQLSASSMKERPTRPQLLLSAVIS